MKTMFRLFFALAFLSIVCSQGSAQYPHERRGDVGESIADPQVPTHEPRFHHPFDDRRIEFDGHERAPILAPQEQVWVVDTALVISIVNTTRHRYSFNGQAKMTINLRELWTNNQWVNYRRSTYLYDTNGRLSTELYERWTNNQWVNSYRNTYTYDANGNMLTLLYEQWTNNQWENRERYTDLSPDFRT